MIEPLVSVLTPFHNTAPYLAQCIESVLTQKYSRFEYILSDNCSTDESGQIAEAYARRDPRIRLIRQPRLLSQVPHYNHALAEISPASQYCKIVQADDFIYPECLQLMVGTFGQSESIGLVSSHYLKGTTVLGSGFPCPTTFLPGKEMARLYLQKGVWAFGSPTTVMYRSILVRNCQPFYDESGVSEDTMKCMQILEDWDFGFVHQVLSFMRTDNDNESISANLRTFHPYVVSRYIMVRRYSPEFLEPAEAEALMRKSKQEYYGLLAKEALRLREPAFWRYQERGLKVLGEKLDGVYLASQIGGELLGKAANRGATLVRALRYWKRWVPRKRVSKDDPVRPKQECRDPFPASTKVNDPMMRKPVSEK